MKNFDQDLAKAMHFCSTKEVCIFDIKAKFKKWNVEEELHSQIIFELINEKFIDEQRYADAFASDKFQFNKWGKIKINFALKKKQINETFIQNALDKIDEEEYLTTITELIHFKINTTKEQNFLKFKNKIYRYIFSKGFEAEIFSSKVNLLLENHFNQI